MSIRGFSYQTPFLDTYRSFESSRRKAEAGVVKNDPLENDLTIESFFLKEGAGPANEEPN